DLNCFREGGASLGTAVFGTLFTTRLSERLTDVFLSSGADAGSAAEATATIDPAKMAQLPDSLQDGIVNAYADALAPVFWYLIPFIVIAFLLALFLKQIPLQDQSGMVARGEAVAGDEAERLERELREQQGASAVDRA